MNFCLRSVRIAPYGTNGGERVKVITDENGHVKRYKARLVAQGYTQ